MYTMYLVCLIVGALYSILSLVLNGVLDSFDFDFDFDFEFGDLSLPIKPFTIMSFLTAFGGAGLIAWGRMSPWLTLVPAALTGALAAWLLYHFLYEKLRKYETHAPSEYDALMLRAQVVEKISPGGWGKISYVLDGNTLSGAAREFKPGGGIGRGANVYILEIKDNVYYVCEDPELLIHQ